LEEIPVEKLRQVAQEIMARESRAKLKIYVTPVCYLARHCEIRAVSQPYKIHGVHRQSQPTKTTEGTFMRFKNSMAGILLCGAMSAVSLMAQDGNIVATGTFHGDAHHTTGRATVYHTPKGEVLRITHFKTSDGPNTHVLLIAADDAKDDQNIFKENLDRVELGPLKGTEGDQNYSIPAGTDLSKYKTVAIYCERFNVTFGAAPLQK
jgi:hypothetical protein